MTTIPLPPLILNTTPEIAARWLEGLAHQSWMQPFPVRDGQVEILHARVATDAWVSSALPSEVDANPASAPHSLFVELLGQYLARGSVDRGGTIPELFAFVVVALEPTRIAVFPRCEEPAAHEYLDHILAMMRATWPDAMTSIDPSPLPSTDTPAIEDEWPTDLSPRDRQISKWLQEGKKGVEIAAELSLEPQSVYNSTSALRQKYPHLFPKLRK